MKILFTLTIIFLLSGCGGPNLELDSKLEKIIEVKNCEFRGASFFCVITNKMERGTIRAEQFTVVAYDGDNVKLRAEGFPEINISSGETVKSIIFTQPRPSEVKRVVMKP